MDAILSMILGLFTSIAAVLLGMAVVNKKVKKGESGLFFKAAGLVAAGVIGVYGLSIMSGAPVGDFRPISLIMGTWGAIWSMTKILGWDTIKSDNRYKAGVVVAFMIFLTAAWWPMVSRVQAGGPSALIPVATTPASSTTSVGTTTTGSTSDPCKGASNVTKKRLGCPGY